MADPGPHTALRTPVLVRAGSPMAGALLLALGGWLLGHQLLDVGVASLGLLVGAVLVSGWVHCRRPLLLLVGAPLTGAAVGMILAGLVPPTISATVVLAGVAVGHAGAALVRRSAAVPAVATAALALAASGVDLDRAIPASAAGIVLAAAAIVAGGALVVRPRVPRAVAVPTAAALLLTTTGALAAIAQSAVAAVLGHVDRAASVTTTQPIDLPALDGRPIVIVAPTATAVLRSGPLGGTATTAGRAGAGPASRAGAGDAPPAVVEVVERDDRVELRQVHHTDTTVALTVDLPAGARATVLGGTGDVMADLDGHAVEVETTSGAVTVDGHAGRLVVSTTSGAAALSLVIGEGDDVAVRSESGDVDVHVTGNPRVTAEAGALFIDGYGPPRTGVPAFSTTAGAGALTVATTSRAAIVAVDQTR